MKRGERIMIERTSSGDYHIFHVHGDQEIGYVGGAASTIITLSGLIFKDEVIEIEQAKKAVSDAINNSIILDMKTNPSKFIP